MPRLIEERWVGINVDVTVEHGQEADPQGRPLFDGLGQPKMVEHATLVLIIPLPDGQRIVRVPFNEEAKQELVRKLTGGIVIANGHGPAI